MIHADTVRGSHYNIKTRQSARTKRSEMFNPARSRERFGPTRTNYNVTAFSQIAITPRNRSTANSMNADTARGM
jgi:hypothetical protein